MDKFLSDLIKDVYYYMSVICGMFVFKWWFVWFYFNIIFLLLGKKIILVFNGFIIVLIVLV